MLVQGVPRGLLLDTSVSVSSPRDPGVCLLGASVPSQARERLEALAGPSGGPEIIYFVA